MRIDDGSMNDEVTLGLRSLNRLAKILKQRRQQNGFVVLVFSLPLLLPSWFPTSWWTVQTVQGLSQSTLNRCVIAPSELEALAMDRADRCSSCKTAVEKFEMRHIQELESKRDLRKSGPPPTSNFECQICHQICRSRIGHPTRDDETHRVHDDELYLYLRSGLHLVLKQLILSI